MISWFIQFQNKTGIGIGTCQNAVRSLMVTSNAFSACLQASFLAIAVPVFGAKNAPECRILYFKYYKFSGVVTPGPRTTRRVPSRTHPYPRPMLTPLQALLGAGQCWAPPFLLEWLRPWGKRICAVFPESTE